MTEQLVQLEDRLVAAEGAQDGRRRAFDHDLAVHRRDAGRPPRPFAQPGPDALVFAERRRQSAVGVELPDSPLLARPRSRAGVSCRFHDLRHTSVALAIADGAHPKAIQSRMGHSSINVTLDRYGHLFPELDEAIAEPSVAVRRGDGSAAHESL